MGTSSAHNSKVFRATLDWYTMKQIKPKLVAMCTAVAQEMVDIIDNKAFTPPNYGNSQFPVDSSNLHDATGVGVYVDGKTSAYIPTQRATEPQFMGGYPEDIWGAEELQQALQTTASQYSKGIWIVLFSAVPYAYMVNEIGSPIKRGKGFFDSLKKKMLEEVLTGLKPIKL